MSDAIAALRSLNYTEREAAFLSLVAAHSGYFLRRQYTHFIQRERGALAQNFLQKAKRQGHIRELPCGSRRTVFHLFARRVYAACGDVESSSRHEKSSREIFRRLLVLDYVLDRYQGQSFFLCPAHAKNIFAMLASTILRSRRPMPLASCCRRQSSSSMTVRRQPCRSHISTMANARPPSSHDFL